MIFKPFLFFASFFYWLGLLYDRARKQAHRRILPRPVISVGNLTVGGTGKTPLLIRLAKDLKKRHATPSILTRGYQGFGRKVPPPHVAGLDDTLPDNISDEIMLMLEKLNGVAIGIGADRAASARLVMNKQSPDLFLLDDGFQHWSLARDMDIICIDATDPWGKGHLLPWGRLREPMEGLARARVVVVTRCELAPKKALSQIRKTISRLSKKTLVLASQFQPRLVDRFGSARDMHDVLRGQKVLALSAIGNPESFEESLKKQRCKITPLRYSDHHDYTEKDLNRIEKLAARNKSVIVTTEKDWVKLKETRWGRRQQFPFQLFILRIEFSFLGKDEKGWNATLNQFLREHKIGLPHDQKK